MGKNGTENDRRQDGVGLLSEAVDYRFMEFDQLRPVVDDSLCPIRVISAIRGLELRLRLRRPRQSAVEKEN